VSPTYKNDHNGDVVTVTGAEADRLDTLDNWHRVSPKELEKAEKVEKAEKDK
jgi:hypothetical protein